MSTLTYQEPYKFSAGALALLVHGAFFALLYLGFNWQMLPPQGMVVDIWDSLPQNEESVPALPPASQEPVEPVKAAEKQVPVKAEIEMGVKKKVKKPVPEKDELVAKLTPKQLAAQKAAYAKRVQQENEQQDKIRSKIRRNIVAPPGVSNKISTEFDVTLLPGGLVLEIRMTRSSGNQAYDNAVERGILKAQPLPLPPDAALFNRFRDLHLKFSPD